MSDSGSRLLGMRLRRGQFKQTHRQTDKLIKSLQPNSTWPIPTSTQVLQFKRPHSSLVSCLVSCTCEASGGLLRVGACARCSGSTEKKKKTRLRQSASVNSVKTTLQVMKPRGSRRAKLAGVCAASLPLPPGRSPLPRRKDIHNPHK